jgi:hypothetical protein
MKVRAVMEVLAILKFYQEVFMKCFFTFLVTTTLCLALMASNAGAQNLLTDPDFENGGTAWQQSSGAGRAIVTTSPQSGTHCQQLIQNSSTDFRRVFQNVAITGGLGYQASGWAKASGGSASARIVIFWLASETTPISSALHADTLAITTATTWTLQSANLTAPDRKSVV